MMRFTICLVGGLFAFGTALKADNLVFSVDPFGTADPNDGIRQIVNVQQSIDFDPATDKIFFDPALVGFNNVSFASGLSGSLPTTGLNAIVVLDQPAAAPTAHTAIANQLTDSGPGFFIYFNTNLNLPRLVFARDLGDPTSDIAILARMENLSNDFGSMEDFSASNFAAIPEPSTTLLIAGGLLVCALSSRRRRK